MSEFLPIRTSQVLPILKVRVCTPKIRNSKSQLRILPTTVGENPVMEMSTINPKLLYAYVFIHLSEIPTMQMNLAGEMWVLTLM